MIIQVINTEVDSTSVDGCLYEADITAEELGELRNMHLWRDDQGNSREIFEFRGEKYEYPDNIHTVLNNIGKEIEAEIVHVHRW